MSSVTSKTSLFDEIPLLSFGNEYTFAGIVMQSSDESKRALVLGLPNETLDRRNTLLSIRNLTQQDFETLMFQLDRCDMEGVDSEGEKIILRKSNRVVDNNNVWAAFRRDKYKCRYCGIDNVPLTIDHVVTWETGGATHINNLLTSCRKCNKKRGNTSFSDWLKSKYFVEKSEKYLRPSQRLALVKFGENALKVPKLMHKRSR